jgi:fatty acid desaturase
VNNFNKCFNNLKISEFHIKTNWHGIINYLFTISIIFFISFATIFIDNLIINILFFISIGALQHRLSIFLHECLHFSLFKNKNLNIFVGKISAYLIFFSWGYRKIHLKHHMHLGHDEDPVAKNYTYYPTGGKFFLKDLLLNLFGFAALNQFLNQNLNFRKVDSNSVNSSETLPLLVTQCLVFCFFFFLDFWWGYLVFWILPLVTIAKTLAHFRNVAEHVLLRPIPGNKDLERLRTIKSNFIEKFFFAPLGFNYHAEHHMFPGVPYHKLASLSRLLMEEPYYKANIDYYNGGYCSLLIKHAINPT